MILYRQLRVTSRTSQRRNCKSGLCCFAPPCARSAGFANNPLEILFGLLEFLFAELFALGFDQILETFRKSCHRGFWFLGRCRHVRTSLGVCALAAHIQCSLLAKSG